jgi:DNA mismatch endonuclease (patch repair protein)
MKAVKRRWQNRGDIMSPEKRSALMSRIKGRDTGPERAVASALSQHGLTWDAHPGDLPGRPDFVFRGARIAIFVDGDFWHGWRFPAWRHKMSAFWEAKLEGNIRRDRRNRRRLQRLGWLVLRLWEHQIEQDLDKCTSRILSALALQPTVGCAEHAYPVLPTPDFPSPSGAFNLPRPLCR